MDVDRFRENGGRAKTYARWFCQSSRAEIYKVVFQIWTGETWRERFII
jgi:hypothetical protein